MAKYAVLMRGENFVVRLDAGEKRFAFYSTRFVEANDRDAAELQVVDLLRSELKDAVLNDRDDPPMLFLEEIHELESFAGQPVPGTGFTWFEGDE